MNPGPGNREARPVNWSRNESDWRRRTAGREKTRVGSDGCALCVETDRAPKPDWIAWDCAQAGRLQK